MDQKKGQGTETSIDWSPMTAHLNQKDDTPRHLRTPRTLCPAVEARIIDALVVPSEA